MAAEGTRMTIIPGLTTTKPERVPAFIDDLKRLGLRTIALFPTCLDATARAALYRELEAIPGLSIPHVHVRADCDEAELEYLTARFQTEAFNIHPRTSSHPFGTVPERFRKRLFVENVDVPPNEAELGTLGGLCPDFSHLENARLFGREAYVAAMSRLLDCYPVGCCHLSAIRTGFPNVWSGEWDHHEYESLRDLSYLAAYRTYFPTLWASLELENTLDQQLQAIDYLTKLFRGA